MPVPVRWLDARPTAAAFRNPDMVASQHSSRKLRQEYTLGLLAEEFGLGGNK